VKLQDLPKSLHHTLYDRFDPKSKNFDEQAYRRLLQLAPDLVPGSGRWSDKELLAIARKFKTRAALISGNNAAYAAIRKRGEEFAERCFAHMQVLWHKHTDAQILAEAQKHQRRSHWQRKSRGTYAAAVQRGEAFFKRCCEHMDPPPRQYSNQEILADAKKFRRYTDWEVASPLVVVAARNRGDAFYKRCTQHLEFLKKSYTDSELLKISRKYSYRTEWCKADPGSYQAAKNRGLIDKIPHLASLTREYSEASLIDSARPYSTRMEWHKADKNAYQAAAARNLLDKCCAHMGKKQVRTGRPVRCSNGKTYSSYIAGAKEIRVSPEAVRKHLIGKSKSAGGYTWSYVEDS
jgi:hypothetical protein